MSQEQNNTITMTLAELESMKQSIETRAAVDALSKFMTSHDTEDTKRFDALFKEIRQVDQDVNAFPQRLAECQKQLREETEAKYVSKKEVRAGFLTVSALQIVVGLIIIMMMNAPHA